MPDRSDEMLAAIDLLPVQSLPVDLLLPGDSPRLSGSSGAHIRMLAQVEEPLPPVLVHRSTMKVIDGMHRLKAAKLRGHPTVQVRFFDGDDDAAFVLAVQSNVSHGLPLTLNERIAAAARIVAAVPLWSDRAIARVSGLSAVTVAGIRQRSTDSSGQTNARLGRDGRVRPLNSAQARLLASSFIAERPDASLREIAREAGMSLATARDVRMRLNRGEDPVPVGQRQPGRESYAPRRVRQRFGVGEPAAILQKLRNDPSLRYSDPGRGLLAWLTTHALGVQRWREFAQRIPPHRTRAVAELARGCAIAWESFADELEERASRVTDCEQAASRAVR